MTIVVIAFNGGFLDRSVHAFDLAVRPRVLDLSEPVLDAILAAAHVKYVGHVFGCWAIGVSRGKGELNPVVREDGVDFVGNSFDQSDKERGRRCPAGLL